MTSENNSSPFIREKYFGRETWLKARHSILGSSGASEASTRLGINPWETIDSLYDVAIGLKPHKDLSNNQAVVFGTNAENPIRRLVSLDLETRYAIEYYPFDILRMKDKPYIFATLDGELTDLETGAKGILEIKTGSFKSEKDLAEWENLEKDEATGKWIRRPLVPLHYFAQVCQQLLVTGWSYAIVVARIKKDLNIPGELPEIRWFYRTILRDNPETLESIKLVEESSDAFHQACVTHKRPNTVISNPF